MPTRDADFTRRDSVPDACRQSTSYPAPSRDQDILEHRARSVTQKSAPGWIMILAGLTGVGHLPSESIPPFLPREMSARKVVVRFLDESYKICCERFFPNQISEDCHYIRLHDANRLQSKTSSQMPHGRKAGAGCTAPKAKAANGRLTG